MVTVAIGDGYTTQEYIFNVQDPHGPRSNSVLEDVKEDLSGWLGGCLKDVNFRHIDLWTQCCSNVKLNFFG